MSSAFELKKEYEDYNLYVRYRKTDTMFNLVDKVTGGVVLTSTMKHINEDVAKTMQENINFNDLDIVYFSMTGILEEDVTYILKK
jgi:hypothetical protein